MSHKQICNQAKWGKVCYIKDVVKSYMTLLNACLKRKNADTVIEMDTYRKYAKQNQLRMREGHFQKGIQS